jgi:superfamily II DNA or RNA helicase
MAREKFLKATHPNFLTVACPGAGKTTFALTVARELLDEGSIHRVVVVVPTASLRTQWAGQSVVKLSEGVEDGVDSGLEGAVVTYASLRSNADELDEAIGSDVESGTLVIMDEPHHAEMDSSYGQGLLRAFGAARRRLLLTGTPWRTNERQAIPFVRFDDGGQLVADFTYDYGMALKDKACRPIEFCAVKTTASWSDKKGEHELSLTIDEKVSKGQRGRVLRSVLDPEGDWVRDTIKEAHSHLEATRKRIPDAAGLIIARDQKHAMALRSKLAELTGVEAPVAVSGDTGLGKGNEVIAKFRHSSDQWIIAVNMIAEGVDIPRLTVGIYATNKFTDMFFVQVVGRFVRTRPDEDVLARLYVPSLADIWECAREIDKTRLQVLKDATSRGGKGKPNKDSEKVVAGFRSAVGMEVEDVIKIDGTPRTKSQRKSRAQIENEKLFASAGWR